MIVVGLCVDGVSHTSAGGTVGRSMLLTCTGGCRIDVVLSQVI